MRENIVSFLYGAVFFSIVFGIMFGTIYIVNYFDVGEYIFVGLSIVLFSGAVGFLCIGVGYLIRESIRVFLMRRHEGRSD